MRYTLYTLLLILFAVQQSTGQDTLQQKHLVFKIAPLALLDIDNTFQFAIEHRLKGNRWTLSEELGYGTVAANLWGDSFNDSRFRENIRAKIEARKYKNAFTGRYISYELLYKQINDRIDRNMGKECEDGGCNYYEKINYPVNKYVVGLSVKIGYQFRIRDELKKNTNFVFDFYIGGGLRHVMINHHNSYESVSSNDYIFYRSYGLFGNSGFGHKDNSYNTPQVSLGIKLGYIIF